MSMKLLEKLLTEKLTYLNPPDRSDKKTFYNIRKYLKELSRYKLRKDIKEQELDELIRFVKNVDTYVQKSEDGARAIRFIQNDLINVDLFERILNQYFDGNLISFIHEHTNFPNLQIKKKKYDINSSNEVGAVFRTVNEYFEKNPTRDRYKIYPMIFLIQKVLFKKLWNAQARDLNLVKYFFSNETYLTNTQAFWVCLNQLWQCFDMNNIFKDQWLEVFSKYERLEGGYVDRASMATGDVFSRATRDFVDDLKDRNKEITIYRGFLTRQNRFVRKGIKKINNPYAEQQDEGAGLSYSTNKDVGIFFASRYHFFSDYILKKNLPSFFGKITEDSMRNKIQKMFERRLDESYLKKEARRTLGTYKIKAQDIIFAQVLLNEYEVIADPNNVKLKRYDFINEKLRFESLQRKSIQDLNDRGRLELERKAFFASNETDHNKKILLKFLNDNDVYID